MVQILLSPKRFTLLKMSVIRQKGEFSNGCYKKTKQVKCSYFGKLGVLRYLVTIVFRITLWPYCQKTEDTEAVTQRCFAKLSLSNGSTTLSILGSYTGVFLSILEIFFRMPFYRAALGQYFSNLQI